MTTQLLDKVISEVEKLKQAKDILDEVYSHVDVYSGKAKLPEDTVNKLRYFYDFNDSE